MLRTSFVITIISLLLYPLSVGAGDFSIYTKLGFLDLKETINGDTFVREQGATNEIGVIYRDKIFGFELMPSIGFWGAVLNYEGADLDSEHQSLLQTTSAYYGLKAEFAVSRLFNVTQDISIGPLVGADINYFVRSIGERWLILSAKGAIRAEIGDFELTAGIRYPYYTADTNYGWPTSDFTVYPKGRLTTFADLKYKINNRWDAGVYYEILKWSESDKVKYKYNGTSINSAIANGDFAYQPDTRILNIGISIVYHF